MYAYGRSGIFKIVMSVIIKLQFKGSLFKLPFTYKISDVFIFKLSFQIFQLKFQMFKLHFPIFKLSKSQYSISNVLLLLPGEKIVRTTNLNTSALLANAVL